MRSNSWLPDSTHYTSMQRLKVSDCCVCSPHCRSLIGFSESRHRKYKLAEYLTAAAKPRLRKALSMYRLSKHVDIDRATKRRQAFLLLCRNRGRNFLNSFSNHNREFQWKSNTYKLPDLQDETTASTNKPCLMKRASGRTQTQH